MKQNGQKILVLIGDPEISALAGELCHQQSGEVELRGLDADSINFACHSAWSTLVLYPGSGCPFDHDTCHQIKSVNPFGQVLIIANQADLASGVEWLDHGADDLVLYPWKDAEFSARIRAAIRRNVQFVKLQTEHAYASSSTGLANPVEAASGYQYVGDVRLCPFKREVTVVQRIVHLTRTEYALLVYLFQRTSRPCSSVELLNNVLGYDDENYLPSLHSHVSRLRRKIKNSETTSIETIWCYGYRISIR
jgi:two-component system response regulator MprA